MALFSLKCKDLFQRRSVLHRRTRTGLIIVHYCVLPCIIIFITTIIIIIIIINTIIIIISIIIVKVEFASIFFKYFVLRFPKRRLIFTS